MADLHLAVLDRILLSAREVVSYSPVRRIKELPLLEGAIADLTQALAAWDDCAPDEEEDDD